MENKKGSQLSSNGIMADVQRQENNSLDVNENNRDGFRFVVVYKDSDKFLYYCQAKIDWRDGDKTSGHYLTELPSSDFDQFVLDTNPVCVLENFS